MTVAIHAGQQNFSRAQFRRPARPIYRVDARRRASPVQVDFPARRRSAAAFGVNRHDYALRAETLRAFANQVRVLYGGGVDRYFIRAGLQNRSNVVYGADAAAHGEWDEDAVSQAANHVGHTLAPVGRSRDGQEDQLVGAPPVGTPD